MRPIAKQPHIETERGVGRGGVALNHIERVTKAKNFKGKKVFPMWPEVVNSLTWRKNL